MRRTAVVAAMALVGAAVVSGCGSDEPAAPRNEALFAAPDLPVPERLGPTEGRLSILAWPGYAEDGGVRRSADWVTPFERASGCRTRVRTFGTSDEAVTLMKTGKYDVVSASGDASLRLIASGDVAPVNTDLLTGYGDIQPFLKDREWNSVNGQMYGVPHGWGANLLMWRADRLKAPPDSWSAVFDPPPEARGKVTAYDSPIYIADAALYLMTAQPELRITNPYALDEQQLQAAIELLRRQRSDVSAYWSDYAQEVEDFESGAAVVGTTWQVTANQLTTAGVPVASTLPTEGATGWSDTWMVSSKSEHVSCAYAWMDHVTSPQVNAEAAEFFGEAPANRLSCELTVDPGHCGSYHAEDEPYAEGIWFWTTPVETCLDGRKDVSCTDYGRWLQAWTEVKG